jgi:hypothetical protein
MASFDFISFAIGLLLGMIIMLLLVWIAYYTRSFIFSYCPTQARPCGGADYYNDPGDALANNPQITVADILFLNDENIMYYNRVPKNTDCTPESNQIVQMIYPQYCSFATSAGKTGTWRETVFNSNIYKPDGFTGPTIVTDGNCTPAPGSPVATGVPLLQWDTNPIGLV